MTEAQIQLQNALTTTFLANLAFLSIYDNELYHRVDELSKMIEDGRYEEKYALDFIQENGEFDIYDIPNDKYLYNKEAKKINNNLLNNESEISLFSAVLFSKEKEINKKELIDNLQDGETAIRLLRKDFQEFTNLLEDNPYSETKKFKKYNKFMFIGTLLGRHIPSIAEKINSDVYFICEANLEIFRLALFVIDYTILTKNNGAIFSIMDDEEVFTAKINNFLLNEPFVNHKIKYSTTNINVNKYFELIFSSIVRLEPTIFNHYMVQDCVLRNISNRVGKNKIIMMKTINEEFLSFKDLPVLYICAGPSLEDNIKWIKDNQDKFFIVSIGASYQKLYNHGITSDIIITLDSQKLLKDIQFDEKDLYKIDDAIIFASTMTDEFILNKFDKDKLFLYDVLYTYFTNNKISQAFSVGEMGLSILLSLNFKNIYMIGTDLALNQDTGQTHISSHASGKTNFNVTNIDSKLSMNKNTFGFRGDLIKVKGNLLEEVITSRIFESSILCYEYNIKREKKEFQTIYNLSNHGALIKGTKPLDRDNVKFKKKITNKNNLRKKILLELDKYSSLSLSLKEIEKIKYEIEYIQKIILSVKNLKKENYSKYKLFYEELLIILDKLLKSHGIISIGDTIFPKYFRIILPYINYVFNSKKKIKNEKNKIKEIKEILCSQIVELLDRYINYLYNLIKIK
jgi:hypothetical protein